MKTALSTKDNPYNPITQFDEWYEFDTRKGYNSSAYLARVARTSPHIAPIESEIEIENAIDEILRFDLLGIYVKVTEPENMAPRGG